MDLLNRAYSQLYNLSRSMTPGGRLTAGLLAAAVLLSFGYLFTHEVSSPEVDLMHGVPVAASQLPAMEAALAEANLKYVVRGTSIYVPRGQESDCRAAVAKARALPPALGNAQREAATNGSLFDIGSQRERDRMKIAKQDDLATAICKMSGIESALVVFEESKGGGFAEKVVTAAALVKPAGAGQLDETTVATIRNLLAGAIPAKPENVTVADLNGRTWYGNSDDAGGATNLYRSLKQSYEQDLKAKVLNTLGRFIPNVTVDVNVVLDRERIIRTKQYQRALEGAGDRQENVISSRMSDQQAHVSSQTPASTQRPNVAAALDALWGGSASPNASPEPDSFVGSRMQVEKESLGPTPISAKVAVGVPVSYFKKVWAERNPSIPGQPDKTPDSAALDQICAEVTEKIQRHVAQLLPPTDGVTDAATLVRVTPFQDASQEPSPASFGQNALAWAAQSWGTLSMIGLGLVSLLVLRSMVRSAPLQESPPTKALDDSLADEVAGDERVEPSHGRQRRHVRTGGPSPREELSALVEKDPEMAVHILSNWIGQGG